jgi:hypothetical protein
LSVLPGPDDWATTRGARTDRYGDRPIPAPIAEARPIVIDVPTAHDLGFGSRTRVFPAAEQRVGRSGGP